MKWNLFVGANELVSLLAEAERKNFKDNELLQELKTAIIKAENNTSDSISPSEVSLPHTSSVK